MTGHLSPLFKSEAQSKNKQQKQTNFFLTDKKMFFKVIRAFRSILIVPSAISKDSQALEEHAKSQEILFKSLI